MHGGRASTCFQTGMKHLKQKEFSQARDTLEEAVTEQNLAASFYERAGMSIFGVVLGAALTLAIRN